MSQNPLTERGIKQSGHHGQAVGCRFAALLKAFEWSIVLLPLWARFVASTRTLFCTAAANGFGKELPKRYNLNPFV
jgi:hypothetical protein